ncbi:hypothetical protein Goari_001420, partial [Gossypium aridum]|nr:hypothetical protein [Gossypium aridum]
IGKREKDITCWVVFQTKFVANRRNSGRDNQADMNKEDLHGKSIAEDKKIF